jgi:FixJ family two-component response regulator
VTAYGSASEFLDAPRSDGPACALLDLRLPDLDGMELYRRLRETTPSLQVIFLSGFGDIPITVEAIKSGAFDFLTKPVGDTTLLATVDAALAEATRCHASATRSKELTARFESLTRREREVLHLVVAGRLNKQIARELQISEKTVKVHRSRVMQKMGTRRLAQLVGFWADLAVRVPKSGEPPPAPGRTRPLLGTVDEADVSRVV